MLCISLDLLLNLSTVVTFVLLLARYSNFAIIKDLASRCLMVNNGCRNIRRCQEASTVLASDGVEGGLHSDTTTSAYLPAAKFVSVNKLVRGVSCQAPEPMTPSTDDGVDFPPFEQSSDGSNSEPEVDLCETHDRPRSMSAPSESRRCLRSASDLDMCQTRNRFHTSNGLSQSPPCDRQVNSILNKLTRERFECLYQQLLSICSGEDFNQEVINVVARGVFAKATVQHTFADMYAEVCSKLYSDFASKAARPGVATDFKRSLLEQCQNSFEVYLQPRPVDASLNDEEQFEQLTKYKTKMLGNVRLIAHLIRLKMLSSKIIFDCTDELLKVGSAETLESLCTLVSTLGDFFNAPQWHTHVQLLVLFSRIRLLSEDAAQTSRIRFLMKNVLDERNKMCSDMLAIPAPKEVKPLPVLLGRTGPAIGGDAPASDMKRKEVEVTMDGPVKQMEHLPGQTQSNEKGHPCDSKPGHEICLPICSDSERTPLRATASLFKPVISKQEEAVVTEATPKTSIMLRNIPADFSRSAVLDLLRSEGFADQVVFVYVPMNLRSLGNFGYAFVDFDSMATAERCKEQLEGFARWNEPNEKVLEVAWSDTQGLDAQIARYRDSPLMHESVADEMKPALYNNGDRIAFPAPTKNIKAPRLRKIVEPVEPPSQ